MPWRIVLALTAIALPVLLTSAQAAEPVATDAGEAVYPQVATFTRVCAYDRPGTTLGIDRFSRSDSVPMPRTAADAVADLHALLGAAAIPPPYVLAEHST